MLIESKKEKSLKDFMLNFLIGVPLIILAFFFTNDFIAPIRQTIYIDHAPNIKIIIPNKGTNSLVIKNQDKTYHATCFDNNFCNPHNLKNTTIQNKYEGKNIEFLMIRHTDENNGFVIKGDFYDKTTGEHYKLLTSKTQMNKSIRSDLMILVIIWLFGLGTIGSSIFNLVKFLKEDH